MKKTYLLLPTFLILAFSGYTQEKQISKKELIIKKVLTPRDLIRIDLNPIMNSCAGLPNNYGTWATVKQKIVNLLFSKWKYGGVLKGTKAEEAYFVNVGTQTMTQNDVDKGKLIVLVGLAMIRPAEFEIIKLEKQL